MGRYADVVMTGSSEGNNHGMRRPIRVASNMDTEIGYQGDSLEAVNLGWAVTRAGPRSLEKYDPSKRGRRPG